MDRGELVQSGIDVTGDVLRLLDELNMKERKTVQRKMENVQWTVPPFGKLKINLDGSFVPDSLQGSWGFVVRDHVGSAVLAGAGNLGLIPDAITAEVAACAKALQEATDHGISQIQIETDSIVLKQALQSSSMDFATCGMLIGDTRDLLDENFVCTDILSVPRVCNSVAHNLAKVGLCWDPGVHHVWADPLPEFVKNFVARYVVAIEPELVSKKKRIAVGDLNRIALTRSKYIRWKKYQPINQITRSNQTLETK